MDFDIDTRSTKKQNIELLNCQIELILRSLEFYSYTYNYIYPRRKEAETLEENLRKTFVTDTYHQITAQIHDEDTDNNIIKIKKKA